MKKIYILSILFCFAMQSEPLKTVSEEIADTDTEYVYIPKHIQEQFLLLQEIAPHWSKEYYRIYANTEEHIACKYDDVSAMLEKLLLEMPDEYSKRQIITDYYESVKNKQCMLEDAPIQIAEIIAHGMPTRYKRYKQFGSILVQLLEVAGKAYFTDDVLLENVGIKGSVSIDKNVRVHGDQIIDGKLVVAGIPVATTTLTNAGRGEGELVVKATGSDVAIKSIKAGSNITITNHEDDVMITATLSGGAISGPRNAVDHALVRFDGHSGQVIESSGIILDDANNISGIADLTATGIIQATSFRGNAASATKAVDFTGELNGDVAGYQNGTIVNAVGGISAAIVAASVVQVNAATDNNTGNTLILRNSNGDFSANIITATMVTGLDQPINSTDATHKQYVDSKIGTGQSRAISLSDGSGNLVQSDTATPVIIDVNNSISQLKDITAQGNLNLPNSTNAVGVITKNNLPFISNPGGRNTFIGINAGRLSLTGTGNVAIGTSGESPHGAPLQAITNGQSNVAIGNGSMSSLQLGMTNIAIGNEAFATSTIAAGNIAIGAAALLKINDPATVVGNIVIGSGAGVDLTSGNNNIYIGTMAGSGVTTESGHIRIGGQVKQTACTIQGISGSTSALGVPVLVNSNGDLGTATSSERYKKNIKDMGTISNDIHILRPVTFVYKEAIDQTGSTQYGLIAEEVAKVYPDLVVFNEKNEPETVKYHVLNILLLNELQKMMQEYKSLKEENSKLANMLININSRIEKLEKN